MKPNEIAKIQKMTPFQRKKYIKDMQEKRIAAANAEYKKERDARYEAAIPKKDLIHGAYYGGDCRNAEVARWNEDRGCFVHWRIKFGERFTEEIKHPEDEKRYDVFVVKERIDNPVEEIPFEE